MRQFFKDLDSVRFARNRACNHPATKSRETPAARMQPDRPAYELDRREIWSAGLPLSHSLSRLCPETDVADFRRKDANRKPFSDSIGALVALFKRDMTDEARTAAMAAQAEYSESNSAADEALRKLQRFLVHQLRVGNYFGFGYSVPRGPNDAPLPIPLDVWEGAIDWTISSVKGNRLEFVAIRILPKNWLGQIQAKKAAAAAAALPAPEPKGRPQKKIAVPEAFERLRSDGRINFSKPKSHCYPLIREYLAIQFPGRADEYRDMSDDTISRGIGDLFERAKLAQKAK